jgi:hypothetical protein
LLGQGFFKQKSATSLVEEEVRIKLKTRNKEERRKEEKRKRRMRTLGKEIRFFCLEVIR